MAELNITERKRVTHSGRKTRNKGLVPGVVYGKEMKNFMFEVSSLELCVNKRSSEGTCKS